MARWAIKKMAAHKKKAAIKCDKPTNKSCFAGHRKSQRVIKGVYGREGGGGGSQSDI